ncbi:MAG: hypothetical protein RQ751_06465 [Longimicrobiales bacterium]|nr:hypothetical protein [Longimicrobiales bacterium]
MKTFRPVTVLPILLAGCVEHSPMPPDLEFGSPPVASEILDGNHGGSPDLYFLPPLVNSGPPSGAFNPYLRPTVQVCLLMGGDCGPEPFVIWTFGPGDIKVGEFAYQVNWDTDVHVPAEGLDHTEDYRIRVLLAGEELGHLDVDPQDPNGTSPSLDREGFHTFRLGENLPVKFWISQTFLCDPTNPTVTECIAGTILYGEGGRLSLDGGQGLGDPLGLTVPANSLPEPEVTFILERLNLSPEECLPGMDTPQFGPCLRIRHIPEDLAPLALDATVSVCIDLLELGLDPDDPQTELLQIFKWDDASETFQALANTASDACPGEEPPGDGTLMARVLRPLFRLVGPRPLVALHLGLGGLTRGFSQFQWVLPGELSIVSGGEQIWRQGGDLPEAPVVRVNDLDGNAIEGVLVDFTITAGGGNLGGYPSVSVTTDGEGYASPGAWTVGSQGTNTLTASGLGLFAEGSLQSHVNGFPVTEGFVTFSAVAAGDPSSVVADNPNLGDAYIGMTLQSPLVVTVADDTDLGVPGVPVTWTASDGSLQPGGGGDGVTILQTTTGLDGKTSAVFTLGNTVGPQTVTASVGGLSATFTVNALCREGWGSATIDAVLGVEWTCAHSASFTANLGGGGAPSVLYWMNDADHLYLAVEIQGTMTENSLRFDFLSDVTDGVAGALREGDDGMNFDPTLGTAGLYTDEFLTKKCTNSSQSGCGDLDVNHGGTSEGGADFDNTRGGVTIYELFKPLRSGDPAHDLSLAPGDEVGFFGTLRLGKGAKGNTQFPGFRDWVLIKLAKY